MFNGFKFNYVLQSEFQYSFIKLSMVYRHLENLLKFSASTK